MNVLVTTRNLSDLDEAPNTVVINDEEKSHRIWLSKHCFWAMRSNRSVTSSPTDKPVSFVDKTRGYANAS